MTLPTPCSLRLRRPVLSVVLVSWVLGSTLAFAEDDRLSAYHGEWQRIADDAADDARLSSIDLATGDLSWLVRKMATGVLEKTTMPPGELAFFEEADGLRQHVRGPNGEFERPVAVDAGPTQHTDPGGEETTIEWKRTAEGLEAHWAQSRAYGRNLYRLDEGGQTLHVEHHIQVTAIEGIDEIVYGSRFGRTAVPPVSSGPPAEDVSGRELDLR